MAAHRETGFPITIVRPSHTYDTIVPVAVGKSDYTIIDRIRRGKPVIVHGEGTSLWTLTHADDFGRAFIGLLGNPRTIGHAVPHHLRRMADLGSDPAAGRSRGGRRRSADRAHPERVHRQARSRHGRRADRRQELERAVRQREDQELRSRLACADPVRGGDPPHRRLVRRRSRAPDRRPGGRRARRRDPARLAACRSPHRRLRRRRRRSSRSVPIDSPHRMATFALRRGEGGMVYGSGGSGRRLGDQVVVRGGVRRRAWSGAATTTPAGEPPVHSGVIRKQDGAVRLLRAALGQRERQPPAGVRVHAGARRARRHLLRPRLRPRAASRSTATTVEAQPETPLPAGTFFWRVVDAPADERDLAARHPVARERPHHRRPRPCPTTTVTAWRTSPIGAPAAGTGSVPVFFGRFFGADRHADVTLTGGDAFGRGDRGGRRPQRRRLRRARGRVGRRSRDRSTIYDGGARGPDHGHHAAARAGHGRTSGRRWRARATSTATATATSSSGGREVAQVFLGGANGVAATAAFTLAGAPGGDALVVQGPGDVNGDGAPDVFVGGVIYLGDGSTASRRRRASRPGPWPPDFAGDNDGDGLTDFAANQGVFPGTPAGIDPNPVPASSRRASSCSRARATSMATATADVVSSIIAPSRACPERERVYFGAPTGCGTNGCRAFSPLFIPGLDFTPASNLRAIIAAAGDINGDGGDDLVVLTPENGDRLHLPGGRRARAAAGVVPAR